jgi:hypothetical protein
MSYDPIYEIESKNAAADTIIFRLKEKSAGVVDPMPVLPLYGYKFTFNQSRYGLGLLNTKVVVDLLDDGTIYDLFNNSLRNDIGLEIESEDIGQLFWGFADLQQLERVLFEPGKRGVRIVFYNPCSWTQNIGYYTPAVQNELADLGIIEGITQTPFIWFTDYFVSTAFKDFENANNAVFSHRFEPQRSRFTGALMPDFLLFNELALHRETFPDNISIADTIAQISRSFFFRYGWSITHQAPFVGQLDIGFDDGEYNIRQLKTPKINVGDTYFLYDIDSTDDISLPVLEKNKFLQEVTALDVPPYISVTYNRVGPDRTSPNGGLNTFTQDNPDFTDPFLYDSYRSSGQIPFDPGADSGDHRLLSLTVSGTDPVLASANGFLEFTRFPAAAAQDLPSINALLHMLIRQDVHKNLKGVYRGLLDPLIPHLTDFDDNAYIIVRGEYDLIRETTIIQESITIFEVSE